MHRTHLLEETLTPFDTMRDYQALPPLPQDKLPNKLGKEQNPTVSLRL